MFESSPDLSVSTVSEIVRLALAPVFLLSGIGAFLGIRRIVRSARKVGDSALAAAAGARASAR